MSWKKWLPEWPEIFILLAVLLLLFAATGCTTLHVLPMPFVPLGEPTGERHIPDGTPLNFNQDYA